MADAEPRLVPVGPHAEQPGYSDAHVVQTSGEMTTIFFMKLPPIFTEEQRRAALAAPELKAPAVAAVTMHSDLAQRLADTLNQLLAKKE